MGFHGSCPACGAEIEFSVANSVVVVCENCDNVVGRGDGKLEQFGKVADLVQTDSPLQIGLQGKLKGTAFEITGRTQLRHSAGGVWDEWYLAFYDGKRWGWLAEAQGRYYLTLPKKLPDHHTIPELDSLQLEDQVMIPTAGRMKVTEIGEATLVAAEGEIPFQFEPGERVVYADLSGAARKFATLDYSSGEPQLYVGIEASLDQLGIEAGAASREQQQRTVAALAVNCPHCGGSLELRAPDETERVACPFCDSLLELEQGNLKFLETLSQDRIQPLIPLGSRAVLEGREYTVIGFLRRAVRYESVDYPWTEYLLYTPRQPFHWLINNNGHWTLGKPLSAADVEAYTRSARYQGKTYRIYDRSVPRVTTVYGEFYWKVNTGERVGATDYIRPPYILSREETLATGEPAVREAGAQQQSSAREVNYTLGRYLPHEKVAKAFQLDLPRPIGVAPNQPYAHKGIYAMAALMLAAAVVAGGLVAVSGSRRQVFEQTFSSTTRDSGAEFFSDTFTLRGMQNIRLTVTTPQLNEWAYLDGSFYREADGKTTPFTIAVPRRLAGQRRKRVKYLSALPGGEYRLRLKLRFQPASIARSRSVTLSISQGVPRMRYWVLLLLGLATVPVGVAVHQVAFEAQRWQESDFSPFSLE